MLWTKAPTQVGKLRQFTADDPWSGTSRASFSIEATSGGFAPAYAMAEDSLPRKYAIVSSADGKRHKVPDVLAGLWLSGKIQAESLPALLKALQPSLNYFDYVAHMSLTLFQRRFRLWVGPVVAVLILLLVVAIVIFEPMVRQNGVVGDVLGGGLLAAVVIGGIPGVLVWLLERRRQQQIEQVLQLATAPTAAAAAQQIPEVRWLGKDDAKNPFRVDGYDCLALVRAMQSITTDKNVAETFLTLRSSVGSNHLGQLPAGAAAIDHRLEYPCKGIADGIVFKSRQMEQKWDIYLYGDRLYFCRSWTDALVFVANFSLTKDSLVVENIWVAADAMEGGRDHVVREVDYLIKSHLLRRAVPHPLPESLPKEPGSIGLYSFSQYGNLCCFGTYDDTLRNDLSKPRPNAA